MTATWKGTILPTILPRYQLRDIYNTICLFSEALSSKTYHFKGQRCSGGKHSKKRITEIATSNTFERKIPMFVIRKSSKARCFKHVQNISLVKLSYHLKWGYEAIKQLIRFLSIQK